MKSEALVKAGERFYRRGAMHCPRLQLALFVAAFLLGSCDGVRAPAPADRVRSEPAGKGRLDRSQVGTPAPATQFEGPDGEAASFAEFRGKPLLVNLWATWCAPCVAEMPTLDALALAEPRIQVLALSQDLDGRQKVHSFFEERKFKQLEPFVDPQLELMGELKVQSLPTTILYDANGRELWRMTGSEDWQGQRARKLVAEATAG